MKHKDFIKVLGRRLMRKATKQFNTSSVQVALHVEQAAQNFLTPYNRLFDPPTADGGYSCVWLSKCANDIPKSTGWVDYKGSAVIDLYKLVSMGLDNVEIGYVNRDCYFTNNLCKYAGLPKDAKLGTARQVLLNNFAKKVWEYV